MIYGCISTLQLTLNCKVLKFIEPSKNSVSTNLLFASLDMIIDFL